MAETLAHKVINLKPSDSIEKNLSSIFDSADPVPAPKRRRHVIIDQQNLFGEHQSSESKLLVASAPLRSTDSDGCGDTEKNNKRLSVLADVASGTKVKEIQHVTPLGSESSEIKPVPSNPDPELQVESQIPRQDSSVEVVPVECVSRPSDTPYVHPQIKRCDRHRENHKGVCGYKDKENKMCYTHSRCRLLKQPNMDPETVFISCTWCTDWFLYNTYKDDKPQHDNLQELIKSCRKGDGLHSMGMLKALQTLLLNHAAESYRKSRVLEEKALNLSILVDKLHASRSRVDRETQELRLAQESTTRWIEQMEDHLIYSWETQVLVCFDGLTKFFHAVQKHEKTSSTHVAYLWLQSKDSETERCNIWDRRRYCTFKKSWCDHLLSLKPDDIIHLIFLHWRQARGVKPEKARRLLSDERLTAIGDASYNKSPFQFLSFCRNASAHVGDESTLFNRLVQVIGSLNNSSDSSSSTRYVDRRLLLIYDELCHHGFRGLLECILKEAPDDVKVSMTPYVDFKMIEKLLANNVVYWNPRFSLQEMFDYVQSGFFFEA